MTMFLKESFIDVNRLAVSNDARQFRRERVLRKSDAGNRESHSVFVADCL